MPDEAQVYVSETGSVAYGTKRAAVANGADIHTLERIDGSEAVEEGYRLHETVPASVEPKTAFEEETSQEASEADESDESDEDETEEDGEGEDGEGEDEAGDEEDDEGE